MARKGYGRNSTLVNTTTHADDGTSPVGSNEWNENPKKDGIFGLTKSAQAISGNNNIVVTDSYIEITTADSASGGSNDGIYTLSAGTAALTPANYPANTDGGGSGSSISEGDLIYVVKAASQGTTTLKHQQGGAGAGKITTLTGEGKLLSATVPTILMARTIGSALEWVEYGGGTASDLDTTNFSAAGLVTASDTIASNDNDTTIPTSAAVKDFAEARANHTGSQAASTITNFATEVGNTAAVAANTAKTGITTSQADAITANTAKTGISTAQAALLSATAGTTSASKALIVDSNKDLTGVRNLTVAGDLTVTGTTTTVNVEDLTVDTADITIMNGNTTASAANDSGIKTQVGGSSFKTLLWKHATSAWTSSDNIDSTAYKIAGTTVLSGSILGSTITASSLTSVGTLGALTVDNVNIDARKIQSNDSNGNLELYANGSGVVKVLGDSGSNDGAITLNCRDNSHGQKIQSQPHSASASNTLLLPTTASNAQSTLVSEISTQTLENKTLGTGTAVTLGSDATLDIYYRSSTGALARLAKGAAGEALKINAANNALEWGSAGGAASVDVDFSNTTTLAYRGSLVADSTHAVGNNIATRALGTARDMYIRKIDDNNEGVFTVIHKNGTLTEVQIA